MKKIFSFLTLFAFFFIGFIHNSMIIFAMNNIESINISEKNICCFPESKKDDNNCMNYCCIEGTTDQGILPTDNKINKKILKIIDSVIDRKILTLYSFNKKSLINKTSPPYYYRYISNYSYHTLVKIIKSNT